MRMKNTLLINKKIKTKYFMPREYIFKNKDYNYIKRLIYNESGILLDDKEAMVYARVSKRLKELGFLKFSDYCSYLQKPEGHAELSHLVNALTTNLTRFFREEHHFHHLSDVLRSYGKISDPKRIRIWSAGCSSGEEAYSIAMVAAETLGFPMVHDFKILATDIDTNVLAHAVKGEYRISKEISPNRLKAFFKEAPHKTFQVCERLKKMVVFNALNILGPWPMKNQFDIIFCRNVVIYFDRKSQIALFDRFADILKPGGWLYIGHSENLCQISDRFQLLGRTIYQKVDTQ
jgi:chemotaxis protein methyltransferase CheR